MESNSRGSVNGGAFVKSINRFFCGICGAQKVTPDDEWFLLSESRWQDRLKILRWNDQLALQNGLHCACGVAHVQEMVIHWMFSSSWMKHHFLVVSLNAGSSAH